jgi:hypothetical protein
MIYAKKIQNLTKKALKNAKPILKLPIIWLGIFEINSRIIANQIIGNFMNGFAFMNTSLLKFFFYILYVTYCMS